MGQVSDRVFQEGVTAGRDALILKNPYAERASLAKAWVEGYKKGTSERAESQRRVAS
jgi:hypothetical protein